MIEMADAHPPGPYKAPSILLRLMRRPFAVISLVFLFIVVIVAVVAPFTWPTIATQQAGDLLSTNQGPSRNHWLGTDTLGRDVLLRILVGTRTTIVGLAIAVGVAVLIGVPGGLVAGYRRGWSDRVIGWWTDLAFALPTIIVIFVVLTIFPRSMIAAMVALGVMASPGMIRVTRSATLPVREELYVDAARVAGLTSWYILARHILPRISGPIIVQASLLSGVALIIQTALAFLNLVVAPPAPSWGGMIADGLSVIQQNPWLTLPPGMVVSLTILAFGLLGDSIRDVVAEGWAGVGASRVPRAKPSPAADTKEPVLATENAVLEVEGLTVNVDRAVGAVNVLVGVSFSITPGETLAVVGESGSGKTMAARSILGLLPPNARINGGTIRFVGKELTAFTERQMQNVRGREIGWVSQEPMVSLTPVFTVGWQLEEVIRRHQDTTSRIAKHKAIELLEHVGLPSPVNVARSYPHELSGGMAQRVAIARALAGNPKLLIADEPTTALDVTLQAEILTLLRRLQQERQMALLLVTHDWGVVADIADRVVVMYAGQVVEQGPLHSIFQAPLHPYTAGLLASDPHRAHVGTAIPSIPGVVPPPEEWPQGCHFQPRCKLATESCAAVGIPMFQPVDTRLTRCIHYDQLRVKA